MDYGKDCWDGFPNRMNSPTDSAAEARLFCRQLSLTETGVSIVSLSL